jgi:hypothetical protein
MRWEGTVVGSGGPASSTSTVTAGGAGTGGSGVVCLQFDRKDIEMNKLVATAMDGRFSVFDVRTQHPSAGFARVTERVSRRVLGGERELPLLRSQVASQGRLNLPAVEFPARTPTPAPARPSVGAQVDGVDGAALAPQPGRVGHHRRQRRRQPVQASSGTRRSMR